MDNFVHGRSILSHIFKHFNTRFPLTNKDIAVNSVHNSIVVIFHHIYNRDFAQQCRYFFKPSHCSCKEIRHSLEEFFGNIIEVNIMML